MRCLSLSLLLVAAPVAARTVPEDWGPALLRSAGVDPAQIRCNRDNRWGDTLRQDAQAGAAELMAAAGPALRPLSTEEHAALQKKLQGILFWRMVRAVIIEGNNNNIGVIALRGRSYIDSSGRRRPLLVFRSGLTPSPQAPGSCFQSLLQAGGVRHVVNLFDGDIPAADLVAAEARAAAAAGASYTTASDDSAGYGPWRELLRNHYDDPERRLQASRSVARLIREQILAPGGAPPRGNIHIHCGGGMHRSGMIAGILERCINREPLEVVEAHYRYHVGWRGPDRPGGLEEGNLRFIREFDCTLLEPSQK
ncbi:MAG: hypothetical protein RMK29_00130 [Myxococcales bacterium]|nr:hypothetical protein [Myxococcota bacterium]MDW8280082.1 hypothetical protein [Myxococcales bacterium]